MVSKRITSPANIAVKEAARLKRKRYRYERRRFIAEGEDLLDAALARGFIPRQVFVLEGHESALMERVAAGLSNRVRQSRASGAVPIFYICSQAVLEKLSELGSGTRVIAVFEMLDRRFPAGVNAGTGAMGSFLYLAGVGDPGNVGTLMRSAAALGAAGVLLGPGVADPYSPKSLRATMGAIFQISFFLDVPSRELVSWAGNSDVKIVCADAHAGSPVWQAELGGAFVLVMGSEREGIPHRLKESAGEIVRIPQAEGTESINVAMAGAVIMYESLRQRRGKLGNAPK